MKTRAKSIATKHFTDELINELVAYLRRSTNGGKNKAWTRAVWEYFRKLARKKRWKLYPKDAPYKGEYLVDFMLFEDEYGPRIACESQWSHWRMEPGQAIDWAFDKLRGVKADLKLLLYEWEFPPKKGNPDAPLEKIFKKYLADFALISASEAFAFLQYHHDVAHAFLWLPTKNGKHSRDEIRFREIPIRKSETRN